MDYKQDLNKPSGPEVWTLDSTKWCRWQYFSLTSWILGPFREVQQDCLHSSENTGAIAAKVLRLKQWTLQPLVILWLRFGSKPDKNSTPHAVRFFQAIQWPWLQDCVQIRLGSRCVFECLFSLFCSQPLHMFASIYTSWWFQTNWRWYKSNWIISLSRAKIN